MSQDEIKFKIDQLRKDKIIYGVEACAFVLACILGFLFVNLHLEGLYGNIISILLLIIGVGYTFFMGIGNLLRLKKIKILEKNLHFPIRK